MSTKFLRKTARRILRDQDNFQKTYPSLIRTSDPQDLGKNSSSYEDRQTIVFGSDLVTFPQLVPAGYTSTPTSTIITQATISIGNPENAPSISGIAENLAPFNETKFNLPATIENTSSLGDFYSFTSPVRNKIGIAIDITSAGEKPLFRLSAAETTTAGGTFAGASSTGFVYYNFQTRGWDDISSTTYQGKMGTGNDFLGQNYFMAQFVGTSNLAHNTTRYTKTSALEQVGYEKIGTPTNFFDAPHAPRYHATNAQSLQLSDYIAQPFVLERIDVLLPFVARRQHGVTGSSIKEGAYRDIDNLVFFVYRQNGNIYDENSSQAQIASSSSRALFAHESLSFYNSNVNTSVEFDLHNPVFSYDHNIPLTSTVASEFTGSVRFSMKPKIDPIQFGGLSSFGKGVVTVAGRNFQVSQQLQNFYQGVTRLSSTNTNVTQTAVGSATPITSPPGTNFTNYVQRNDNITQSLSIGTDPRFLFANPVYGSVSSASSDALGGPTNFFFTSPSDILPTTCSYLLLPTDRLVFGIEADVNTVLPTASYVGGYDNTFLSQTGSFFKILNNEAQVVLYGSLIQNEAAKTHNSVNQQLVSPSVHEIITNVQDDSDQFLIEERERYTLGYLDNFITGIMTEGNRGVAQSLIRGPAISSGSFERFVNLTDNEKTYYQTGPTPISIGPFPFTSNFDIAFSNPTKPKNYFRYDRYGNHRDMLEQAKDYRIFNKLKFKKNGGFEDYGPAYAKFVLSSSEIPTSASLTFCNNLSPYMTATFPFDDASTTSLSRGPYPSSTTNTPFVPSTLIFKT